MDNINAHDLRYLQRMNDRVTDPELCQCPGCRQAGGDLPPMSEEETYRLELMLRQMAIIVLGLAQISTLSPDACRLVIMDRLRSICFYSYMFGVDNARKETDGE